MQVKCMKAQNHVKRDEQACAQMVAKGEQKPLSWFEAAAKMFISTSFHLSPFIVRSYRQVVMMRVITIPIMRATHNKGRTKIETISKLIINNPLFLIAIFS